MDSMITEVDFATPLHDASLHLRYKILREPLGLNFAARDIMEECDEIVLVALHPYEHILLATLNLSIQDSSTLKMRQVAVDEKYRGKGIGRVLVSFSERIGRRRGYKRMCLSARETATALYENMGYISVGKPYVEIGIPHIKMEKEI